MEILAAEIGGTTGGFHFQARWLAFNIVALGLVAVSRQVGMFSRVDRSSWCSTSCHRQFHSGGGLGPLLAITGAGHHSRNNDHRGNVRRPVQRWPAGTIAGMLYALVLRRKGQLSHVVPTHTAINAMISVHVSVTGSWSLWM